MAGQQPSVPISNLGLKMTDRRLFVGRKAQLTALTQAIHGLGGIGKTQLALQFAIDNADDYDIRWWVQAEQAATMTTDIAALAGPLGLPEDIAKADDQSVTVNAVRSVLAEMDRWLLIFDNAESPDNLRDFLPGSGQGHVLITSRNPNWGQVATTFDVNVLTVTDAKRLLKERSKQKDDKAAEEVASRLGRLPLALEVAAAYCDATGMALADYPAVLDEVGLALLDEHKPVDYEEVFTKTWQPSFNAACEQCQPAAGVLAMMSFLAPQDIPVWLLEKHFEHKKALNDGIGALRRYSLISRKADLLSVHRLVQEVCLREIPDETRTEWAEATLMTLNAATPVDVQNDLSVWPVYEELLPHVLATIEHGQTILDGATAGSSSSAETEDTAGQASSGTHPPALQNVTRLLNQFAIYLHIRASFAQAEPLMRRALEIDEQSYGKDHPNVAIRLNNLATLLEDTNRLEDAEPLMRRALSIDEQSYGKDHPNVATDLNNLALLLKATNRLEDAEPLMRRALEIDEQSYGKDHPNVAIRLNNLATLLKDTNRLEDAEPLMRRALEIDEQSYGKGHPKVAIRLNNLATLLQATNRLEDAEPLMCRVVEILAAFGVATGHAHPHLERAMMNYAGLLDAMGLNEQELMEKLKEVLPQAADGEEE